MQVYLLKKLTHTKQSVLYISLLSGNFWILFIFCGNAILCAIKTPNFKKIFFKTGWKQPQIVWKYYLKFSKYVKVKKKTIEKKVSHRHEQ